jgi:hypothetical protein
MSIDNSSFFYDGQIRRFISQFIRLVSNFEVQFGTDRNGVTTLQRVPVMYGDQSRQAAQIMRNNSANTLNTVPAMAVYVGELQFDQSRLQNPTFVQTINVREREFNNITGTYTQNLGESYSIERLMPVPYKLTLKLDIWTSNAEQKFQLIEQLSQLFSPALEIQSTDNYVDWGSLSYAALTNINWTSRTVPTGGEDPIDIATMSFELPIWISSSAKVKKLGVIQSVINNIDNLYNGEWISDAGLGKTVLTPLKYGIVLQSSNGSYTLKLLKSSEVISNNQAIEFGKNYNWKSVLDIYGRFVNGSSRMAFRQDNGSELVGTIAEMPNDPYTLLFTPFPDTIPTNTIAAINAIIDPTNVNVEMYLTAPVAGTRYLLTDDIGSFQNNQGAVGWRGQDGIDLIARANDIVEYNGSHWTIAFDSTTVASLQYCTNLTTGIQYKWNDMAWSKSFEGAYPGGKWSVAL